MSESESKPRTEPPRYRSGPLQRTIRIGKIEDNGCTLQTFVARLYWKPHDGKVLWIDFDLYQPTEQTMQDGRCTEERFLRPGAIQSDETTANLDDAEAIAAGFVKWDGCTQFDVADIHVDHRAELERIFNAILETRKLCAKEMAADSMLVEEYDEDEPVRPTPQALKPQPPPANPPRGVPVWPLIIAELGEEGADSAVLDLMRQRDEQGRAKYGVPLCTNDGRITLVDAFQEALDLLVYLRKYAEENPPCDWWWYRPLMEILERIYERMPKP